jgi:hypothetical protein
VLFILIFSLNSCSSQETKSVCGNKIVEAGEQCDGIGCSGSQICTKKCECESLLPPQLPA